MNDTDKRLLNEISDSETQKVDAYNIRKNGKSIDRKSNPFVQILPKEDNQGIDIYVKENTLLSVVHIPVILTESGLTDVVYNDFHVGKNANVIILAGCGVHNDAHKDTEHDGIHRFYLEENAKVKYIEKHYGEGSGKGKKILNPVTEIYMKSGSNMTMDTTQIKGVDTTERKTIGVLESNTTLVINEKILTEGHQKAKTIFQVDLNGDNDSTHVTSRRV